MPSLVEIIITAQDKSGPAFQSASAGVRGLGAANDVTSNKITVLSERASLQYRQLALLERQLHETAAAHGADSIAATRQGIAYDRLSFSIRRTERDLDSLHREQRDGTFIGQGGGALGAVGGTMTGFGGALGAAAGLFAAEQGKDFVLDALAVANAYTTTETALRSLAGTQQLYNDTMLIARQNQDALGGSMTDQITALSALLPLVRTTNADLATLSQTQQLLASRNPSEGLSGAAFSLQEMLTSTSAEGTRSLQERFNLPKDQLNRIMEQTRGDRQAQLLAIQQLLAEQGITRQSIEAQQTTAATPFRQLNTAWSNFMLREGQAAQNLFGPLATTATGVLNLVSGARPTRDSLGQIGTGLGQEFAIYPRPTTDQPTSAIPQTGAQAPAGQVVYQTINVQGSIMAEQQVADIARRGMLEAQRQNGTTGIK